jgi:antibiotic biosynthesis monooxygenase (ABM) superfamily enzyme
VYINIFHYVLCEDCDVAAYDALAAEMYAIVAGDPQYEFVGLERFATSDREGVVLETFGSLEGATRWARCPEHRAAMKRGRAEFYEKYVGHGTVEDHNYSFERKTV